MISAWWLDAEDGMISRVGFQVFINSSVLKKVLRIFHTYSKTGWPCHMGLQLKMGYPPIWRDYISWLVVLTILKNTSQWEGLAHILWKKTCLKPPTSITYWHRSLILQWPKLGLCMAIHHFQTAKNINTLQYTAMNHCPCINVIYLFKMVAFHIYIYT